MIYSIPGEIFDVSHRLKQPLMISLGVWDN